MHPYITTVCYKLHEVLLSFTLDLLDEHYVYSYSSYFLSFIFGRDNGFSPEAEQLTHRSDCGLNSNPSKWESSVLLQDHQVCYSNQYSCTV